MDNIKFMKQFPDKFFDLANPDIEYGIGASKPTIKNAFARQKNGSLLPVEQKRYVHKDWDLKLSTDEYFNELFRVSKEQIIWGGNYYQQLSGGFLVWDKLNGECDQFGCEMAWTSMSKRTDIVYFLWSGMMQGVYCGRDVKKALRQQGNKQLNEKRIHPTQKPVALYRWTFQQYAKPGYKILDTHMGSQSSRIAADIEGVDFYGCENDPDIFQDGQMRFQNHLLQPSLF